MNSSSPQRVILRLSLPLALAVVTVCSLASGYVLPGGAILRHLVAARESLHITTLRVEGTLAFSGRAVAEAAAALQLPSDKPETQSDATFSLKLPGRCRLDVSTPENVHLSVTEAAGRKHNEGGVIPALDMALSQVCRLLAIRGSNEAETRAELDQKLRQSGVVTVDTGLGRVGDQVVYVLGRNTSTAPQFSIFKDSFLPARIRFLDSAKSSWEVRFLDYNAPAAGEMFPRIIDVLHEGERLARFTVLKVDAHLPLADRLFAGAP